MLVESTLLLIMHTAAGSSLLHWQRLIGPKHCLRMPCTMLPALVGSIRLRAGTGLYLVCKSLAQAEMRQQQQDQRVVRILLKCLSE